MEFQNLPATISPGFPPDLTGSPEAFIEGLPQLMVTMLERRYLSALRLQDWEIDGDQAGPHRPLLREIVRLGKNKAMEGNSGAMPHLLTACHSPGHSVVMVVHGEGDRHRIYLGARRCNDSSATATPDYLEHQRHALKAYFSGLEMAAEATRLDGHDMPALAHLLQTAPALGVMTGIPSGRNHQPLGDFQSIDRLVDSLGRQKYALMTVAEPVDPGMIDQTLDLCRRLKSEVHAWAEMTVSRTRQKSDTENSTEVPPPEDGPLPPHLPSVLFGLASFMNVAAPGLGSAVHSLASAAVNLGSKKPPAIPKQSSHSEATSDAATVHILNANAEACERLLDQYILRLTTGRSTGWWQTALYIAAENEAGLHAVAAAVRGIGTGDGTLLEPLRLLALPSHTIRGAVEQGRIMALRPAAGGASHPLGSAFDAAATCLSSAELAAVLNLPRREIPGLPLREHAEFGLCVPPREGVCIEIGTLLDGAGRRLEPVTVPLKALNRHVFITGMTGYGKTTTCKRLMLEAYEQHGLPFLVVEPAKAEYREMAKMKALRGKLRVYAMGGDSPLPFRLNPLQPVPGMPLARHIDLLKAVFNASFPMFAGMTYILEEALYEVYRERGWSLYTSHNSLLKENASNDDLAALTPTLEDLHAKIDVVLGEKKYGKEVEQNLGAALRSRLKSLLLGNKGIMLNTRRSTPLEDLFRSPAVIELQNLGDDEEKGFVMALLFVLLYEYAEVRQRDFPLEARGTLQHLTLIEEAHRLLQAGGARPSAESADPRGKAVAMFTDMLAEMRAYGEGFIIADQSPTKLVNAVLKNSALKIIHRLTYPDDRQAAGSCINLDPAQIQFLNDLPVGLAVVHDERIGQAVLTQIHPLMEEPSGNGQNGRTTDSIATMDRRDRRHLHRNGACEACPSPCDFFHRLDEFKSGEPQSRSQHRFLDSVLIGEPEEVWGHWQAWRSLLPAEPGLAYCICAMAEFDWLGQILSARNLQSVPGRVFLSPEDHLRRDKAARAVARLISSWEGRSKLDDPARAALQKAQEELRRLVASTPPIELPGCANCPVRCRMLPYVAPSVRSLEKGLNSKLLGERGMTPAQHLEVVQAWLSAETGPELDLRGLRPHLRGWTYCVLSNSSLPQQAASRRDQLLVELAQPPAEPT